uniref:Reverse transcriptase domain-containing protein n=1 Tax=Tanacetum cinerariifolium TaxID=118510 RepID=A0A6L2JB26_TANCI|nr:hypothetical protein [Tanacetum cinerariifolium]
MMCQPDNQKINFSGSDQIQTPQYPDVNPPSPEISNEEIFQAKGDLMKSIQTFLERFNCIPFEEKPQILFQTWETFFASQCSQPEDSNELFQKLLEDLKKLAEYYQSTSTDRPIFLNSDEGHSVQDKESLENPFNEIAVSKPDNESDLELEATTDTELSSTEGIHPLVVQEPPQDSDIRYLIREECCVEVPKQQKQKMEDTMFELVKICQEKEFPCIHDDVDNLIESALDSKLLLINLNSQCLDKQEQEVKNIVEQPAERGNRSIQSSQNFKVVHKSSISFKNTSQISSVHEVAPILSTKEPVHSLSVGYEHLSITLETESAEVTESNAKNLLPIPKIPKSNFDFEEEIRLIENFLYDNSFPRPPKKLNAEIADTIIESIPLPIPVQDGNSQQEEIDIVTKTDDVLPLSIENFADDPEGDIRFLEELLIDDSILSDELSNANFEENSLIPRPPPKPPDIEIDAGEEIAVVMIDKDKFDDDYQIFMFDKVFSLLSAESEDTIFDPGLSLGD